MRELLIAVVEFARKWLRSSVNDFVGTHIAVLRKGLAADVAVIRSLSGVPSLVGLEVTKLTESLAAGRLLA